MTGALQATHSKDINSRACLDFLYKNLLPPGTIFSHYKLPVIELLWYYTSQVQHLFTSEVGEDKPGLSHACIGVWPFFTEGKKSEYPQAAILLVGCFAFEWQIKIVHVACAIGHMCSVQLHHPNDVVLPNCTELPQEHMHSCYCFHCDW
jgi:hypothetical protein